MIDSLSLVEQEVNWEYQSKAELIFSLKAIQAASRLNSAARDSLAACYEQGPLFDGDVPSKSGRDDLLDIGAVTKVVVKGEDGFNACTHFGRDVYKYAGMIARAKAE